MYMYTHRGGSTHDLTTILTRELMSSWMHGVLNKYSLFRPPIKKKVLTDGELHLWLFHFKMCLHRRIYIYSYILLNMEG